MPYLEYEYALREKYMQRDFDDTGVENLASVFSAYTKYLKIRAQQLWLEHNVQIPSSLVKTVAKK